MDTGRSVKGVQKCRPQCPPKGRGNGFRFRVFSCPHFAPQLIAAQTGWDACKMHAKSPLHNATQDNRSLLKIGIYGIFWAVREVFTGRNSVCAINDAKSFQYGNTGLFLLLALRNSANACKNACKTKTQTTRTGPHHCDLASPFADFFWAT